MLRFFRVTAWEGEPHPHEGQGGLAWTHAARPEVEPILPANGPILRGLELPLVYGISAAGELGVDNFMTRLESALEGGLRLVQLREENPSVLADRVAALCRQYDAQLVINGDIDLAARLGAGVHLPSKQLRALTRRPDLAWVGASCHDAAELDKAVAIGVDFVVLGPVQPTPSHPGAAHLGWAAFSRLIEDYPLPVFALGGLSFEAMDTARKAGAHGIAMRSKAWKN
jgi:8-oxo-dGTP diphosphatase